ncbi:hypothetical protein C8A03DRAFT_47915 [Achaetomium macrosporum]|uniref:RBR-type E3 ubiquitin transferase n=1 Tax=Achaetomium macrosporum TaxID=79813 RepID=A0AAN7C1Z4_9PEZI|nr:hypothetical protein C8A03DRAFT_47915 [Achaetomium macrosporum]
MNRHFHGVDDETLSLIIQLQIEDFDEVARTTQPKGKGRPGDQDVRADFLTAIEAYRDDLEKTAQVLADEAMCKSITRAVETDAELVAAAVSEEEQTIRDRALAFRLSGRTQSVSRSIARSPDSSDNQLLTDAKVFRRSRPLPLQPERRACVACTEQYEYCDVCLRALFTSSLVDETLFPPKCCKQPIPLGSCATLLTSDIIAEYGPKEAEFRTPAAQRTYCRACSTFVPPEYVKGDVAYCGQPGCSAQTCTFCKAASHEATDCPQDPTRQDVLRLAAAEGWQHCFGCKRIVELDAGCYHITCRCGAQFCYVCGEAWKRCQCPQWDERRLLRRAEANRAAMVEQERAHLRENHDCDHRSWRFVQGEHECELCHDTLKAFIWYCCQCHLAACSRCRRNRL